MSTLELWLLIWGSLATAALVMVTAQYVALRQAVTHARHEEILRSGPT